MFWLFKDSRYVLDLYQNMVIASGCQTTAKPLSKTCCQTIGWARLGWAHLGPAATPPTLPGASVLGEQFQCSQDRCSHLAALHESCSIVNAPAFIFFFFCQKFRIGCVYQKLSWVSRAAGPRYFPGNKAWTHGDVLLGINASRGHTKICRQEKNKIGSLGFVWGVKRNSVAS